MIVKIAPKRGSNPAGLLRYLFGPGRHNEHIDPHVVAASLGLAEAGWRPAARAEVTALATDLYRPRRCHDTVVTGGHVWHCSLSLPQTDGALSPDSWGDIARAVIDAMGFEDSGHDNEDTGHGNGDSGRDTKDRNNAAPCRWVAVHHGRSAGGNDHIHIVVDLVREDGSVASIWRDRVTLSRLAAQLERRYGLSVVTGRRGGGLPGVTRAEREAAARAGRVEPDRARLARLVRAAAVASSSEEMFVQRLRSDPALLARARYAAGGCDRVVGYAVALRPRGDEQPMWFGGGRLARDLSLPRLRAHWADSEAHQRAALQAWAAPPPRGWDRFGASAWAEAAERIALAVARLATIPVEDRAGWAGAARETAGIYAALSERLERGRPGPLARAAQALAYSAQTRLGEPSARRDRAVGDLHGAALTAVQAGPFGRTVQGQIAFQKQLLHLTRAIEQAHRARAEADAAERLASAARELLDDLAWRRAAVAPSPTPAANPTTTLRPTTPGPATFPQRNRASRGRPGLGR